MTGFLFAIHFGAENTTYGLFLKKTLNLALEIDADFTLFSKTILIIGSELFDWGVDNGYIRKDYLGRICK